MDSLSGISRSLYGQPWSCWSTAKELENEEETPVTEEDQPAADVMRLPKEDMTLFGFCPEQDDFYIVICEVCGLGIKPMGMHHHMNLRHSQGDEVLKTTTPSKTVIKDCDTKPKNKKHVSPPSVVSDYGLGVGPPQKPPPVEASAINLGIEDYNEPPSIRPSSNSKAVKIEAEKLNKISLVNKYNVIQNSYEVNAVNKAPCPKTNSKSSRNARTVHISATKPLKTVQKAVPIKSGFRLQLVDTSNRIIFRRNSKCVFNATSELKVRHKKKHRRNRSSNKKGIISKNSRKVVPILPKVPVTPSPIIAPCPSLAPSPYVALTPLKAAKWSNVYEGTPTQIKASRNLSGSLHNTGGHGISGMMHRVNTEEPVLEILSVDKFQSNSLLQPELRAPTLTSKQLGVIKNQPELRLGHIHGNSILLPGMLSSTSIRVPDIAWSTVHPKPLGVCPLQTRKVGGLITTDRRLDHVWQSMKSALLEQDAYQTTVLCGASSSQPDFHLNHKSSIKSILASLAANNYARNSVCKPPNSNLRQLPHGLNNEKPSLSSVIDVSSVMLIGSNNSKSLSNSNSFLSHAAKATPMIKHNPPNAATQPYPGIFLRNGHYILPRHFKICLKRRRAIPVVNNLAKRLKDKTRDETTENCRNSPKEHCFSRSVPILQFPIPNGLSEPSNNYVAYPEEGLKQVVPQSEIELDVVNSISILTSNGENLCESAGRLSELDQLKNDFMSGFHSIKTASRIMDVNNKSSCRKAASSTLPNVRISSTPGTVQVNTPQITYLTAGPVTFQQISSQMIGQIQLQSKPNQTTASIPLKLISPAQTVSLTTSRTMLLQPEKDES